MLFPCSKYWQTCFHVTLSFLLVCVEALTLNELFRMVNSLLQVTIFR